VSTLVDAVWRRPRHVLVAAAAGGIALGARWPLALLAVAVVVAVAVGRVPERARAAGAVPWRPGLMLTAVVVTLAGGSVGDARRAAVERFPLRGWIGHAVTGRAELTGPPTSLRWGGWQAPARLPGRWRGARVLLRAPAGVPRPPAGAGAVVEVRGGLRALRPAERYLRARGLGAVLTADVVRDRGAVRGGVLGIVDGIRRRGTTALTRAQPAAPGALLVGMVLGDPSGLGDGDADALRTAGLTHLVAASGANVALLAAFVVFAATVLGLGLRGRWLAALGAIAVYVPLAGGGASIVRAGAMGVATVVAMASGRSSARWYAVLLAATVTLVYDPFWIADPGWQMSFVAVLAIMVFARPLSRTLHERGWPDPVADVVAVTLAATLATAPVVAWHFDRASPVTIVANLLAAPLVAPVMWLGFGAAAVGQVAPTLAAPLATLAAQPAGLLLVLARWAADLPGAHLRAPPLAVALLAATFALAVAAVLAPDGHASRARRWPRRRTVLAGGALIGLGLVAAFALGGARTTAVPGVPPGTFQVAFLDVGQGDATLLRDGAHAVLVDAGPPDGDAVERLRDLGVTRLDALLVSHAQADHDGGAAAVLATVPTTLFLDGRDGIHDPDGDAAAAVAARRGIRRVTPVAGDLVRAGPVALHILWPPAEAPADHAGGDPNERAVVAVAQDGRTRVLLTADAESDVTAALPIGPVDVLKVAHHGSADPGLAAELRTLTPRVAGIEVGAHNTYGHPTAATLAVLRRSVPQVVRTDRDGTVTVTVTPDRRLRVRRRAP
jgi:competence protein ComEC